MQADSIDLLAPTDLPVALLAIDKAVLEVLSTSAALEEVFNVLCKAIEQQAPGSLCAAQLLNRTETHLTHGAAPSLPENYNRALVDIPVGAAAASFGTAVYRRQDVITSDIASDPIWMDYRKIAVEHGLLACWSTPITWSGGRMLGTLSMYYRECRGPNDKEQALLQWAARLAGIAIERTQALEALKEQQQELQIILDSAPVMIWYKDKENRILRANQAAAESLGLKKHEIEGRSVYELHAREAKKYHDDDLDVIRSGKSKLQIHEPYEVSGGEQRFVITDKIPYRGPDGDIIGVLVFARDVTPQKRAENALREAEARFRTLVEQLPTITYIAEFGAAGSWSYVSPQIQPLLGFSPAEWIADSEAWKKQLHPEDRIRVLTEEAVSRDTGEGFVSEYRMCARDGSVVWFRDEANFLRNELGEPGFMMGVLFDITARKRMEEQLRETQKMEAIGRLAGGIAHDFNNLLMVILGYSDILLENLPTSASQCKSVKEIKRASDRAAALTRQLLAFSRRQVLKPQVLEVNSLVSEMGAMLRRIIGADIQLDLRLANDLGCVRADETQIEQVVLNLALNARDAMPAGGSLTLETANVQLTESEAASLYPMVAGTYVLVSVIDTGIGMDEQTKAHIFEPFFTTKEQGKGTGLGLATVYGIVKQSGGWIWVYSELGQGSTFKVYLPRVQKEVVAAEPATPSRETSKCSETILVVDDEDGIRELLEGYLTAKGYTVLTGRNAAEALEVAQKYGGSIDLLITDLVLPKMGGYELANHIRVANPRSKVCYMSGWIEGAELRRKIEQQMCIMKPFTMELFGQKIREVLMQRN